MPRPMTAADREPQEGDILLRQGKRWVALWVERFADPEENCLYMGRDCITLSCERSTWGSYQYASRADRGPVMVEG